MNRKNNIKRLKALIEEMKAISEKEKKIEAIPLKTVKKPEAKKATGKPKAKKKVVKKDK